MLGALARALGIGPRGLVVGQRREVGVRRLFDRRRHLSALVGAVSAPMPHTCLGRPSRVATCLGEAAMTRNPQRVNDHPAAPSTQPTRRNEAGDAPTVEPNVRCNPTIGWRPLKLDLGPRRNPDPPGGWGVDHAAFDRPVVDTFDHRHCAPFRVRAMAFLTRARSASSRARVACIRSSLTISAMA